MDTDKPTSTRKRVLVIDDDDDFRATVSAVLASEGFEVAEASSGREGLQRLASVRPHLVILDVMMENAFEGYGVNQAIKYQPEFEQFQSVPIVMVSSVQEAPEVRFGRKASEVDMVSPDRYLTKPLDVPLFLQTVRQLTLRA